METNPRYITQISSEWIGKVSKAANLKQGPGIKLTQDGDGIRIELDQEIFKQWIWSWIQKETTTAANRIEFDKIGSVDLDPGQ